MTGYMDGPQRTIAKDINDPGKLTIRVCAELPLEQIVDVLEQAVCCALGKSILERTDRRFSGTRIYGYTRRYVGQPHDVIHVQMGQKNSIQLNSGVIQPICGRQLQLQIWCIHCFFNQPADVGIAVRFSKTLSDSGIDLVRFFQGTAPDRVLVEIQTSDEEAVFAALLATARAFEDVAADASISALELLMMTPGKKRAGQFEIEADASRVLNEGVLSPADFFMQYVQF